MWASQATNTTQRIRHIEATWINKDLNGLKDDKDFLLFILLMSMLQVALNSNIYTFLYDIFGPT